MMKKISLILAAAFMLFFSPAVFAYDTDEYIDEKLEAVGADELYDFLDGDCVDLLKSIGVDDIKPGSLLGITPSSAFEAVKNVFVKKWTEPVKGMLSACGTALLMSFAAAFVPDDEKSKTLITATGGCFAVLSIFAPAYNCMKACVSCMLLCADFEKLLIPVLAALLTVAGKPASALTLKGASFFAAELISSFAKNTVLPAVLTVGVLHICSGIMPEINLKGIAETLRKAVTYALSIFAALFSGFITLKGALASAADGIGIKAVKLVSSTFIPVVGSALGEAFTTITGSMGLLKNTVGIFGIIVFAAITLPVLSEMLMWIFAVRIAASISEISGINSCTTVFNGFAYTFSMLNTVLLLNTAVLVISAGTVAVIGTGG